MTPSSIKRAVFILIALAFIAALFMLPDETEPEDTFPSQRINIYYDSLRAVDGDTVITLYKVRGWTTEPQRISQ